MPEVTKLPIKSERVIPMPSTGRAWPDFDVLHHEIDRLFDDFGPGLWRSPFRHSLFENASAGRLETSVNTPAVDIAEKDGGYEIIAELPGIDEKDIEVKLAGSVLSIKGERRTEREEKKKDYMLCERSYGAFARSFNVPDGVDVNKIMATFKNGLLTVTLPKSADAKKHEKKIDVRAA